MLLNIFLNFIIGIVVGFSLEFTYRSLYAKKLVKPNLPSILLYGLMGITLAAIHFLDLTLFWELILILVSPTLIEFAIGYFYLKIKGVRLWDYSGESFNFMGIIRLRFSIYWFAISAFYYYLLLPFFII